MFHTSGFLKPLDKYFLHTIIIELFFSKPDRPLLNIHKSEINGLSVGGNGMSKAHMTVVLGVNHVIKIDAILTEVNEALKHLNTNQDNTEYTLAITPTRLKPMSKENKDFATFYDTNENSSCPVTFAASELQFCEGVETEDFTMMDLQLIKVNYL